MGAAIILGAGDGIGGALAERFAKGGLHAILVRRDLEKAQEAAEALKAKGYQATGLSTDVRDPEQMTALFDQVEADRGSIDACLYNAGANVQKDLVDTTPKLFRQVWELACFGGFLAAQECANRMPKQGKGSLIFTSATSSFRARKGFAAFASAKFGLRAVAQAAARELGPQNIHVGHVIIDCGVYTEAIRKRYKARDIDIDTLPKDTLASTDSIADAYWYLHSQPRDAWTHELDLRPFGETW